MWYFYLVVVVYLGTSSVSQTVPSGTILILVTDPVWGEWSEWGSVTNPAVVEPERELELVRARILEVADQIVRCESGKWHMRWRSLAGKHGTSTNIIYMGIKHTNVCRIFYTQGFIQSKSRAWAGTIGLRSQLVPSQCGSGLSVL